MNFASTHFPRRNYYTALKQFTLKPYHLRRSVITELCREQNPEPLTTREDTNYFSEREDRLRSQLTMRPAEGWAFCMADTAALEAVREHMEYTKEGTGLENKEVKGLNMALGMHKSMVIVV